jgi:protein-S-isoprenylcysteine O-methyltransferase Ste14
MNSSELGLRLATLLLFVLILGISSRFRMRAEQAGGALDRSQGGRTLIALRLVALMGLTPLLLWWVNPAWVAWARLPLPMGLRWLAVAAGFALVPAMLWLFRTIGTNISPRETTRQGHQLVTDGPYRYVRHPLYTLGAAFYLALAVATALWWLLLVLAISSAVLAWRTRREEANLLERFGDDYRRYMERTGRFLPRLG